MYFYTGLYFTQWRCSWLKRFFFISITMETQQRYRYLLRRPEQLDCIEQKHFYRITIERVLDFSRKSQSITKNLWAILVAVKVFIILFFGCEIRNDVHHVFLCDLLKWPTEKPSNLPFTLSFAFAILEQNFFPHQKYYTILNCTVLVMAMCQNNVFHFIWILQWDRGKKERERDGVAWKVPVVDHLTKHPLKLDNIRLY